MAFKRLMCLFLAIIALTAILPFAIAVSAAPDDETQPTEQTTEPVTEATKPAQPDDSEQIALTPLPPGAKWVKEGEKYVIKRDENFNTLPVAAKISDTNFDHAQIKLFVANLETKEVITVDMDSYYNYVGTMPAKPGYYAAYANGISWESSAGTKLSFNNDEYLFFCIDVPTEKFGIQFTEAKDCLYVSATGANVDSQAVPFGQSLFVTEEMKVFPKNLNFTDDSPTTEPTGETTNPTEETTAANAVDDEKSGSVLVGSFLKILQRSGISIVLLAAAFVAWKVYQHKQEESNKKRAEQDKYDDERLE